MKTSDSLAALLPALVSARQAFAPIHKESTAQISTNRSYQYAPLDVVLDAVLPALLERQLLVVQTIDVELALLITRLVHGTSGEWIEAPFPLPLDQAPQQLGSNLTYARRYALLALLCLAPAGEDDDGAAATPAASPAKAARKPPIKAAPDPPAPPAQAPTIRSRVSGTISAAQQKRLFAIAGGRGWSRDAIKQYLVATVGVASTGDIEASAYDGIVKHFLEAEPS